MIDKVIHYCWFGGNQKSDLINRCIESWKKYCPDYQIIEWNESNFDVNMFDYTRQAYKEKKYAFVSDVARLYVVYNYGGIYLDTDIELKDSLDNFLGYDGWFNWESNLFIATGLGFGAQKGNKLVKDMLEDYKDKKFYKKNGSIDLTPCPKINTLSLLKYNKMIKRDGTTQIYDNVIFCDEKVYNPKLINHQAASWCEKKDEILMNKIYKDRCIKRKLRNPQLIDFLDKHIPNKLFDIYIFFFFFVLENGIIYFLKRKIGSLRRNK